MEQVVVSWSGGKDAALALHETRAASNREVVELLTTVNAANDRVSMHGVRRDLLERQAEALELPLRVVPLPEDADNETHRERLAGPMADYDARGVDRVVFADIFLEGARAYLEERLAETDLSGAWPLWGRATDEVVRSFLDAGFRTRVACVDGAALDPTWAGRRVDEAFLDDLPDDVDPCGEHGEFHTFVTDGPGFRAPVALEVGEVVTRPVGDGEYHYADLVPAE